MQHVSWDLLTISPISDTYCLLVDSLSTIVVLFKLFLPLYFLFLFVSISLTSLLFLGPIHRVMGSVHSLRGTIWPSRYSANSYHKGVMGISTSLCIISMTIRLLGFICGHFPNDTYPTSRMACVVPPSKPFRAAHSRPVQKKPQARPIREIQPNMFDKIELN